MGSARFPSFLCCDISALQSNLPNVTSKARGVRSEAFEHPGIVAGIVAQEGEVFAVGRGNAPNLGEEARLAQENRRVTTEVHIEERASQRQFTGDIPTFP